MKKTTLLSAAVLILALLVNAFAPVFGADAGFAKFTDVPAAAWYRTAAVWCYENGVMSGTSGTTFAPNATVTRAMIVTCLARIDGADPADYPTCRFDDCPNGSWYAPFVEWAYVSGVTAGTGAAVFSPDMTLTREQLAAMLFAYAKHSGRDTEYDPALLYAYSDASDVFGWARAGVAWCVGNGLMSGTSTGVLSPEKTCTRAEMAQMLWRMFAEIEPDPVSDYALRELFRCGYIKKRTLDSERFVTRLEFAADVIHVTGFDADIDYYARRGEFPDMPDDNADTWAAEIAVNQGYMLPRGRRFEPDAEVSYVEVVRGLLYAIGYREYCEATDMFALAAEVGLLDGMSGRAKDSPHVTLAEYGILVSNAIKAPLVQCVNTGDDLAVYSRGANSTLEANYLTRTNATNERLFRVANSGWDIYTGGGCRFGASMIINDDGTIDAWLAGLSDDAYESDWGYYRKSYDGGQSWTDDIAALRPAYATSDWRWTCDPGVVKIGDYYYCGYTSISWADGLDNNMFVARSKDPCEFFDEKWDGLGWSPNGEPALSYDGEFSKWGMGEPCFVVMDGTIYCYVTWKADYNAARVYTAPADDPDWPGKLTFAGTAYICDVEEDSCDVKYVDAYGCYVAVATANRFTDSSYIRVHTSFDGITFREDTRIKSDDAVLLKKIHNMGITGTADGHLDITKQNYISYAYAAEESRWGDWHTRFAPITWLGTETYGKERTVIRRAAPSTVDTEHSREVTAITPTRFIYVSKNRPLRHYYVSVRTPDGVVTSADNATLAQMEYEYDPDLITLDTAANTIRVKRTGIITSVKVKYKGAYSTMIVKDEDYIPKPSRFYAENDSVTLDRLNMVKQPAFIACDGFGNYLHLWGEKTSFNQSQQWLFNNMAVGSWYQSVVFTDYDPEIIDLDPKTGVITPKSPGTTTVTAKYYDMTASYTVIVDENCFG